jgi:hypothetical protein
VKGLLFLIAALVAGCGSAATTNNTPDNTTANAIATPSAPAQLTDAQALAAAAGLFFDTGSSNFTTCDALIAGQTPTGCLTVTPRLGNRLIALGSHKLCQALPGGGWCQSDFPAPIYKVLSNDGNMAVVDIACGGLGCPSGAHFQAVVYLQPAVADLQTGPMVFVDDLRCSSDESTSIYQKSTLNC